jgi:hypothetical protein
VAWLIWRPIRQSLREAEFARARKLFHQQRERLEAKFFQLAGASGKPRGLEWVSCDFEDDVVYARERRSGDLTAFVAVTIRFSATVGGGMEEVEAVGNLRAATAVFRASRSNWGTEGRAIFNLGPREAVQHFQHDLELVGHEFADSTRT